MRGRLLHAIPTDIPIITDNYQVLHFDDEPILFTGTNAYGNRIIGSLVEDYDDAAISLFFHVVVDSRTYNDFRKYRISYLEVLKKSSPIYIIESSYDGRKTKIYYATLDEIPLDNRPTEESFCPPQRTRPTFTYSLRLKGGLADRYIALPRVLSAVQTKFAGILETIPGGLKNILLEAPVVYQTAYSTGSFAVNFEIPLKFQNMFLDEESVAEYMNDFIEYCVDHLPEEADSLYEKEFEKLPFFAKLVKRLEDLHIRTGTSLPDAFSENVREQIRKSTETIAEMSDVIGDDVTGIEICNDINNLQPVVYLDANFKNAIEIIINKIQEKAENWKEDLEPREYKITIYHLNKDSRIGNAYIYTDQPDRIMCKPKIRILGDEPLVESKYTESLHLNKEINVIAKARKADGKYRYLEIVYEKI